MYVVKSPLSDENLKTVSEALQGALVDLVDLSLVAKQIHWNVVGQRFRSVHLQLDGWWPSRGPHRPLRARRGLGVSPDGRAATVAVGSGIGVTPEGWVDDTAAVSAMVDALGAVIARMRERVDATGEPDPVSQHLLIAVTGDLELDREGELPATRTTSEPAVRPGSCPAPVGGPGQPRAAP
ncbi:DNA protection during starvation protein [Streptomyces hirsutus]